MAVAVAEEEEQVAVVVVQSEMTPLQIEILQREILQDEKEIGELQKRISDPEAKIAKYKEEL